MVVNEIYSCVDLLFAKIELPSFDTLNAVFIQGLESAGSVRGE